MEKRILIDLSSLQAGPKAGGAATYTQRILTEIATMHTPERIILFGLYNLEKPFHPLYNIPELIEKFHITLVNVTEMTIYTIVEKYQITSFLIPVAQYVTPYSLLGIHCPTIVVIHDIYDIEECNMGVRTLLADPNLQTKWQRLKSIVNYHIGRKKKVVYKAYNSLIKFCTQPNVRMVTVSEYSKDAIRFLFPELLEKDISVYYSPIKVPPPIYDVQNQQLQVLINNHSKYFLLLSADRMYKNAYNVLSAFQCIAKLYPDYYIVTLNYPKSLFKNHISLSSLSESDLEQAYQHSQALVFASFFEGFGYPPIEAMKYGIPVLASNVTSIPEIAGTDVIYFSPLYTASIFHAFTQFFQADKQKLSMSSFTRYKTILKKQEEDTKQLVQTIVCAE